MGTRPWAPPLDAFDPLLCRWCHEPVTLKVVNATTGPYHWRCLLAHAVRLRIRGANAQSRAQQARAHADAVIQLLRGGPPR